MHNPWIRDASHEIDSHRSWWYGKAPLGYRYEYGSGMARAGSGMDMGMCVAWCGMISVGVWLCVWCGVVSYGLTWVWVSCGSVGAFAS